MAAKQSYRERQQNELEVIKSIFGSDVEDLQSADKTLPRCKWKPINIRITLIPFRGSSNGPFTEPYVKTKLHIVCPTKYPKVIPAIFLEESKGISDHHIEQLLDELRRQCQSLRDKEMIYDLTQTVQAFLVKHNKPQRGSLYDEMLQQRQQREQEQMDIKKQRELLERKTRIDEVERRKELFKCEINRSLSESNRTSSPESSDKSISFHRGPIYSTKCLEHRNSEMLRFHKVGRQIRRGCCLGHSQKGCIAYTGIDVDTGQLVYITEWTIKYSHIEKSCFNGTKCIWSTSSSEKKCCGNHHVDDIILGIEKHVTVLSQLHHKNLIQYECVLCVKRKDRLIVYLVQDFVLGTSIYSISSSLGWCMDSVRGVARGILGALIFLHNRGVSHSHLLDSTVFMDNTGVIRCTDFSLVPILLELTNDSTEPKPNLGDLPALGTLLKSLIKLPTIDMKDFIDKCNSRRTLTASELLEHPFLRPSFFNTVDDEQDSSTKPSVLTEYSKPSISRHLAKNIVQNSHILPTCRESRLNREFKILKYVGKGGFGDVLKARNILDNREYAIKRIRLPARSNRLLLKITREVELLSRLNHENVVRYYNSWIEDDNEQDIAQTEGIDWSVNKEEPKSSAVASLIEAETNLSPTRWKALVPNIDDSDCDSDSIEFLDSKGNKPNYDSDSDDSNEVRKERFCHKQQAKTLSLKSSMPLKGQVMYIQMEFCENCTLRTAIDDNLYENTERLWRFFREIAEGLSHIHQQGIIHRDLKPLNIFLDCRDQIKIGDFGLATTSFLALQPATEYSVTHSGITQMITCIDDGTVTVTGTSTGTGTGTGKVGTALYVAPELTGNASKSTYNQKVDMYTLGIILFEMCQPPFPTAMERIQTMLKLRSNDIVLPDVMLNDNRYDKTVKLLRWLLSHDPTQRPTAEELLASDLVPPAHLEANELHEMLKNVVANPRSKAYKSIVARCLQQEADEILEHTYHFGTGRTLKSWSVLPGLEYIQTLNPITEFVKTKVLQIFRKHGGIDIETPLMSPLTHQTRKWSNPVRLMTHSGTVVVLPTNLRTQFVRHIAMSGVNWMRRYCIGRVYREEKIFNFHPKQNYECAFDIISPHTIASHLVDAELLSIAYDTACIIHNNQLDRNVRIHINHSNLLKSVLMYFNIPNHMHDELFGNILDVMEGRMSKFQFYSSVTKIMEKTRNSPSALSDLLFSTFQLSGKNTITDAPPLKNLMRGNSEAAHLAKAALREIESVVKLAQSLGVKCPFYIVTGLPNIFSGIYNSGTNWQLIVDLKSSSGVSPRPTVLAVGGRYDTVLKEFQKQLQRFNFNEQKTISGAGITIYLDKLVQAISIEDTSYQKYPAINVAVCIDGSRPPLKDVTSILRLLWSLDENVRCAFIESVTGSDTEAQDLVELGTNHIILIAENGSLRIRSWERERFQERQVTYKELTDFIQKIPISEYSSLLSLGYTNTVNMTSGGNSYCITGSYYGVKGDGFANGTNFNSSQRHYNHHIKSLNEMPNLEVRFLIHEKLTANHKRRYENQISSTMSCTLTQIAKSEVVAVLLIELPPTTLNAIVGAINPRDLGPNTEREINCLIERFPKYRRYINEIWNEVVDCLSDSKTSIVALYSVYSESYYRVIL